MTNNITLHQITIHKIIPTKGDVEIQQHQASWFNTVENLSQPAVYFVTHQSLLDGRIDLSISSSSLGVTCHNVLDTTLNQDHSLLK